MLITITQQSKPMHPAFYKEYFRFILFWPWKYTIKYCPILGWLMVNEQDDSAFSIDQRFAVYVINYYHRTYPGTTKTHQ